MTDNLEKMIDTATAAILSRKGYDVVSLHVGSVSVIGFDYFIIASASNKSQLIQP